MYTLGLGKSAPIDSKYQKKFERSHSLYFAQGPYKYLLFLTFIATAGKNLRYEVLITRYWSKIHAVISPARGKAIPLSYVFESIFPDLYVQDCGEVAAPYHFSPVCHRVSKGSLRMYSGRRSELFS